MRLINAHITHYHSIEDSDQFDVEQDVTCLVGKNGSGKTETFSYSYDEQKVLSHLMDQLDPMPLSLN